MAGPNHPIDLVASALRSDPIVIRFAEEPQAPSRLIVQVPTTSELPVYDVGADDYAADAELPRFELSFFDADPETSEMAMTLGMGAWSPSVASTWGRDSATP